MEKPSFGFEMRSLGKWGSHLFGIRTFVLILTPGGQFAMSPEIMKLSLRPLGDAAFYYRGPKP